MERFLFDTNDRSDAGPLFKYRFKPGRIANDNPDRLMEEYMDYVLTGKKVTSVYEDIPYLDGEPDVTAEKDELPITPVIQKVIDGVKEHLEKMLSTSELKVIIDVNIQIGFKK